jgi:hypothetical protein
MTRIKAAFTAIEMMILLAIVAVIMALVCGVVAHWRGIHAGYVVGKQFKAAHTDWLLVGDATMPFSYPDKWELNIAFNSHFNTWEVDEGTFDAAKAGMWFDHDTDTLSDKPIPEGTQ